ncbi:MAG: hypothetical protein HKN43_15185 [Rhodothermales bacterium]|nr:hypothetical protein [Rhodothermales bacterium]
MRILLATAFLFVVGCSSTVEPDLDDIQRNAIIGNWNKYENVDVWTPQGFRFQVGFRADGKYQFVTFDFTEISGTWEYNGSGQILIQDSVCPAKGAYSYSVESGTLELASVDIADDGCGRSARLAGQWLRSGTLDQ